MKFHLLRTLVLLACVGWIRAASAAQPKVVLISGEYEYQSRQTLPLLAQVLRTNLNAETVVLLRPEAPGQQTIPGLEALDTADLLVLFMRRMTLPESELARFKTYLSQGKPLVALRTASHSFENWKEFDHEILGGNYHDHLSNKLTPAIALAADASLQPLLFGVTGWTSSGSLYLNNPLRGNCLTLLTGTVTGQPTEPVAWVTTNGTGRVFYTSLGHSNDFNEPSFMRLLQNGSRWAMNVPIQWPYAAGPRVKVEIAEFDKLRKTTSAPVLDVRTPEEFDRGHIPGAINIDMTADDFEAKVKQLDPNQPYLIHCAAGNRSARACKKMETLNFNYLAEMPAGFVGWEKSALPIERKK